MKRFLFQTLKYSLLIFLLANGISFVANYFLKKSAFFKPSYIVREFEKGNELDFIIAGSSRGLTSLETGLLDSLLDKKGFNLSLDDSGLPSHFLMIQHYFESGFKAKNCILVIDQDHFTESKLSLNDNDYRIGPFADRKYIRNYFLAREKGFLKPLASIPYLPMLAYSYYNTELTVSSVIAAVKPNFRYRFDVYGDFSYPNSFNENIENQGTDFWEREMEISNPLIKELEKYLKEKNCQLILYIAPYKSQKLLIDNKLGVPLINHSDLIRDSQLFYDEIHVNENGRRAASLLMENDLKGLLKN